MTAQYVTEIDLHPGVEAVSDQGPTQMCMAFAPCGVLDTLALRAGVPIKHSPWFLAWFAKQLRATVGRDVGMPYNVIALALRQWGICGLDAFDPMGDMTQEPGLAAKLKALRNAPLLYESMPHVYDDPVMSMTRRLNFGQSLGISIDINQDFRPSIDGVPWTQQDWDARNPATSHAMEIMGVSFVHQRFLAKNSEGPACGDGGYIGVPFDKVRQGPQRCVQQAWYFAQSPYESKPVEGFMPGIPTLSKDEARDFATLVQPSLRADLEAALIAGGGIGLRDECARRGVTDKMVEETLKLQRGDAQAWFKANNIPRGDMVWLDIV